MIKRGQKGKKVKEIQEWLCLHGILTAIDGDFGPATDLAVKMFQESRSLFPSGRVDDLTMNELVMPLEIIKGLPDHFRSISKNKLVRTVLADLAYEHLKQRPREVGGENMGPWVRFYTNGYEGTQYPWCAGFVSKLLEQIREMRGPLYNDDNEEIEIEYTLSCDRLASMAFRDELLYATPSSTKFMKSTKNRPIRTDLLPKRGHIFLIRKTETDWTHTGIVVKPHNTCFETIEGNTNDEGSREGYKVCRRIRAYSKIDFIET